MKKKIFPAVLIITAIISITLLVGCKKNKPAPPPVVDTVKPVISLLDTVSNSQNAITFNFNWSDNVAVTTATLVLGGNTFNVLGSTTKTITGLTPSTSYTVTLTVKDAAGNAVVKSFTFTTLAVVPVVINSAWLGKPTVSYGTQFAVQQNAVSNQLTIIINNGAAVAKSATSLIASFGPAGSAVKNLRYSLNGGSWKILPVASGNVDFAGINLQPGTNTFICYFAVKVNAGVANGSALSFQFTSLNDGSGANAPVGGSFQASIPVGTVNSSTQATALSTAWFGSMRNPNVILGSGVSGRDPVYLVQNLRASGPAPARWGSIRLKNPYSGFAGLVFDNSSWAMTIGTGDKTITNYLWQSEYINLTLPNDNNSITANGTTYNNYYVKASYQNNSASTFNSDSYTSGLFGFSLTSKYDLTIYNSDGQVIDLSDAVIKQDDVILSN